MTPDERKMLEESVALSRENNKLLRKMRRATMVGYIFKTLYVAVIIGVIIGSYYLTLPYLEQLKTLYGTVNDAVGKVQDVGGSFDSIINNLR